MMKEHLHQIDKLFRENFEQARFEGMDEQWNSIYQNIQSHKKRRVLFLWVKWGTLAVIGVTVLLFAWHYFDNTRVAPASPHKKEERMDPDKKPTPEHILATHSGSSNPSGQEAYESSTQKLNPSGIINPVSETTIFSDNSDIISSKEISVQIPHKPVPPPSEKQNPERSSFIVREKESPASQAAAKETPVSKTLGFPEDLAFQPVSLHCRYCKDIALPAVSMEALVTPEIIKNKHRNFNRWEAYQIYSFVHSVNVPQGSISGFRGGAGISYFLTPNLFLSSSLSILYHFNQSGFNTVISQASYGLSKQTSYYGIEAKHLQYLHIPVLLGVKWQRHRIMAGVGINYFIGAFGSITEINLEGQPVQNIGTGWIKRSYANTLIPEYNLYYNYTLRNMTIGASMHYSVKPAYPGSPVILQRPDNYVSVGLNIVYPLSTPFAGKI